MKKRALVIGSQIHGLQGVEPDVHQMAETLEHVHGFQVERRVGARATRAGILEGYRRLAEELREGDAAVVYYSGHGQLTRNSRPTPGRSPWFQGIVPTDFDDSTNTDYRGISAWELSLNLLRLTRKTKNVTVLLDCCHSSRMSRDGEAKRATARALARPGGADFRAHFEELRALYADLWGDLEPARQAELDSAGALSSSWSNPDAVRLVACGYRESALEYMGEDGTFRGAFTEALLRYLRVPGEQALSWGDLARAVRERVHRNFPTQRPDIEGPLRRRPFSLAEADERGAFAISEPRRGQYRLHAGRLGGVSVGDLYGVVPMGTTELDPAREIARVSVISAAATSAEAVLKEWHNQHTSLPEDAIALPLELAPPRRPVTLQAPSLDLAELEKALMGTRILRAAHEEDGDNALATLRLAGERLTVEDVHGPLAPPFRFPQELNGAVQLLVDLGVAQGLRELEGEHGVSEKRELSIELGKVEDGAVTQLPDRGARLGVGEILCVRVCNRSFRRLYVHFFNLGVRGQVTRLSSFAPSGVALDHDEFHILGEEAATGELLGLEVCLPDGFTGGDRPLVDEIFVIVTSSPVNLHALETPTSRLERPAYRAAGSPLQDLLAQLQDGLPRDVRMRRSDGFLLKRLPFFVEAQAPVTPREG
jgi:Caspase domain